MEISGKDSNIVVTTISDLDIDVKWKGTGTGYVVQWGYAPDKLYHSYQVFDEKVRIGGLVKGRISIFELIVLTKMELLKAM